MNWHFLGQQDYPQDGQEIILRWNDNHETREIWSWAAYQNWEDIHPISWRIVTEKDNQNDSE